MKLNCIQHIIAYWIIYVRVKHSVKLCLGMANVRILKLVWMDDVFAFLMTWALYCYALQWYSVDFGKNDVERLQFICKFLEVRGQYGPGLDLRTVLVHELGIDKT